MNGGRRETRVPDQWAGGSLLAYIRSRFTYQSGDEWETHLKDGRIALNGKPCERDTPLAAGDILSFSPPEIPEPEVPDSWRILDEDERYLFIDKPAGLPCHPSGIYRTKTLWNFLQPAYGTLHLVNRLDRETSGIVVAAKNGEAAGRAARSMAEGGWQKEYRVVVEGAVREPFEARGYLVSDERSPVRKKLTFIPERLLSAPPEGSRYAHTLFRPVAEKNGMTELIAELLTGKTHQIRATLHGLGFPVTGDKLYGRDPTAFLRFIEGSLTPEDLSLLRLERQALHCRRIAFTIEPGLRYDILSPLPPDWPFTV